MRKPKKEMSLQELGGQATLKKYGKEHYKKLGKKTLRRYGKEHFKELARKRWEKSAKSAAA